MTELGRRGAILIGTMVFAVIVVKGAWHNGDLIYVVIQALVAGIVFGLGGLIIGNLLNTYVFNAARREVTRLQLEKEIRQQMALERAAQEAEETEETAVAEGGSGA